MQTYTACEKRSRRLEGGRGREGGRRKERSKRRGVKGRGRKGRESRLNESSSRHADTSTYHKTNVQVWSGPKA